MHDLQISWCNDAAIVDSSQSVKVDVDGGVQGPGNEATAELLERVNASGKAFLVHTELSGRFVARMAIGGSQTQERHIRATWQLISDCATQVLAAHSSSNKVFSKGA